MVEPGVEVVVGCGLELGAGSWLRSELGIGMGSLCGVASGLRFGEEQVPDFFVLRSPLFIS